MQYSGAMRSLIALSLLISAAVGADEPLAKEVICQDKLLLTWQESRPILGLGGEEGSDDTINAAVLGLMHKWKLPGAALAIAHDGKLVFTKSYGFADSRDSVSDPLFPLSWHSQLAQPDDLFRLASVSKTFTAVEILYLVQHGKLGLDDPVLPMLEAEGIHPKAGYKVLPQIASMTVRELVNFTSGFDSDDPTDHARAIAGWMGVQSPPRCFTNIEYELSQGKIDYPPAQGNQYANFPYCMAAYVIKHAAKLEYEDAVKRDLLIPLGITRARVGLSYSRVEDEVDQIWYGNQMVTSVFDPPKQVWPQWGSWSVEATGPSGGWINSAIEEVRFLVAIDGTGPVQIIDGASRNHMTKHRDHDGSCHDKSCDSWYGLGWNTITKSDDWLKVGGDPGMTNDLRHLHQGYDYAILFNGDNPSKTYNNDILATLDKVIPKAHYGNHDWFDQYGAGWSDWKDDDHFKAEGDNQATHGHYAIRLEGRRQDGTAQFRARFAPLPAKGKPALERKMLCSDYVKLQAQRQADGYRLLSLQTYFDGDKLLRYQATWLKP
jgi:N-acyl-D-amino-acid deacylase